ncbi:MAG: hypothetical protein R2788_19700 [Saprospiraceae bacterium]
MHYPTTHDLGERPYRWNWQTPIHLSKHNQDILYMGSHKLFRSLNQGDDWEAISPDLTKGAKKAMYLLGRSAPFAKEAIEVWAQQYRYR